MEPITRTWYGMCIDVELRKKTEQAYEDYFCDLIFSIHSDDFQYVKAAGRDGDGKADGYLAPEKCVFQSYAPSSGFKKSELLKKIEGDFNGAVTKWKEKISKWTFVHNSHEGLPKYGLDKLDDLRKINKTVITQPWGPQKLKEMTLGLSVAKLTELFGNAPTQKDFNSLTHEPIKTLLRTISKKPHEENNNISPVSVDKLLYNELSSDVAALLNAGRRKENLVGDILNHWPDPEYGEELAESFRQKYQIEKENNLSSDEIFIILKTFAGGDNGTASHQVASLAVLSYFFDRCDIFENAPKGWVK